MRILVDMDGVITDFERGFLSKWRELHRDKPFISLERRNTFYIHEQYPQSYKELIRQIYHAPNFYRSLPPIPGAAEALKEMASQDIEAFICSSPLSDYRNCVLEKYEWVEAHLGADWTQRVILTKNKTVVCGDILIDDNPGIGKSGFATWEHVIFDQPYNRGQPDKRRLNWRNWKTVLFGEAPPP